MSKIKLAWLEQSGIIENREQITTILSDKNIDFYRYNWKSISDPFANVQVEKGLSWSKGREALYFTARNKKIYDYYIFCDDDLIFEPNLEIALDHLNQVLQEKKPDVLTIKSTNWQDELLNRFPPISEVYHIFLTDLHFHIVSAKHCESVFPVRYDGGLGTLWTVFSNKKLNDFLVLQTQKIRIRNSRHSANGNYGGEFNKQETLIWNEIKSDFPEIVRRIDNQRGRKTSIQASNLIFSNDYENTIISQSNKELTLIRDKAFMETSKKLDSQKQHTPIQSFDNEFDFGKFISYQNQLSQALKHILYFENINLSYSKIPKNACTSIFTELAKSDGFNWEWAFKNNRIHAFTQDFKASRNVRFGLNNSFKLVALRDPIKRVISAFKNKILSKSRDHFIQKNFVSNALNKKIEDIRPSDIIKLINRMDAWQLEPHFAPQWNFLFFNKYDYILNANVRISEIPISHNEEIKVEHSQNQTRRIQDMDIDFGDLTVKEYRFLIENEKIYPNFQIFNELILNENKKNNNLDLDILLWDQINQ